MAKNLLIVESPAKAKTIAGYLGSDFTIESSYGHIRDLPKKQIGVDVKSDFEPQYVVAPDKEKIVRNLKKVSKGNTLWLASDGDREGEAIAWHVCQAIGADPKKAKRIVFHEITKPAIAEAMASPRVIDMKLVQAQQARRILDRLVGYELSPVLWRKVRAGTSAGRVQSVAVRLIVEREREIKVFQPKASFKLTATFGGKTEFTADLSKRIADKPTAKSWLKGVSGAKFKVADIEQKPGVRSPGAPFTTSTLQQEAGRRLGYSVRQTMTLAQRLYESGHITYMRTDSTSLSPIAVRAMAGLITKTHGKNYLQIRQFKTKSRLAQEAHEAIRPTNFKHLKAGSDARQSKLYDLIWRRTVASQMAAAKIDKTEVRIDISDKPEQFIASGEVLVFDGFIKVYGGGKEDKILPNLSIGQQLELVQILAQESYDRPPARYSEPSLVKKLEELGIGRPSTYAPTIGTIQDRQYVEKKDLVGTDQQASQLLLKGGKLSESTEMISLGSDKNKLVPTTLGEIVTDFLIKYFSEVVDYDFTARAEQELDEIAAGVVDWHKMLEKFYAKFHPLIAKSQKATRAEVTGAKTLGKDPKTGLPVIARYGRYGPVLQLGESGNDKDDKNGLAPRFAPLPEGISLDEISLELALPMFNLPRDVGKTADGQPISANIGRFGPYLKVGDMFVSIKDQNPLRINENEARQLIKDKEQANAQRVIADWGELKVLNGPYGPYITDGSVNIRVAKGQDPKKITEEQARIALKEGKPRSKPRKRK